MIIITEESQAREELCIPMNYSLRTYRLCPPRTAPCHPPPQAHMDDGWTWIRPILLTARPLPGVRASASFSSLFPSFSLSIPSYPSSSITTVTMPLGIHNPLPSSCLDQLQKCRRLCAPRRLGSKSRSHCSKFEASAASRQRPHRSSRLRHRFHRRLTRRVPSRANRPTEHPFR